MLLNKNAFVAVFLLNFLINFERLIWKWWWFEIIVYQKVEVPLSKW